MWRWIVGFTGVDKRIDVLATAINFGATAGIYSTLTLLTRRRIPSWGPVAYTGMILENALHRDRPLIGGSVGRAAGGRRKG